MDSTGRHQIKQQLKQWESEFFESHKRKPQKEDISAAPEHVRQLYRQYSAAKSNPIPNLWDVAFQAAPAKPTMQRKEDTESATNRIARKLLTNLKENLPVPAKTKKKPRKEEDPDCVPVKELEPEGDDRQKSGSAEKCEVADNISPPATFVRPAVFRKRSGTFLNRSIPFQFLKDDATEAITTKPDSSNANQAPVDSKLRTRTASTSGMSSIDCSINSRPPFETSSPTSFSILSESQSQTESASLQPQSPTSSSSRLLTSTSSTSRSKPSVSPSFESQPSTSSSSQTNLSLSSSSRSRPSASSSNQSRPSASSSIQSNSSISSSSQPLLSICSSTQSQSSFSSSSQPKPSTPSSLQSKSSSSQRRPRPSPSPEPGSSKRPRTAPTSGDGNFVRLNLRVKRFARKGMMRQRQARIAIRREKWRRKFGGPDGQESKCFLCGNEGHWAKKCPARRQRPAKAEDSGPPEPEVAPRSVDLERLELGAQFGDPFDDAADNGAEKSGVAPLFEDAAGLEAGGGRQLVLTALRRTFGLRDFRPGQQDAIERVLCGQSTLLMMPTGGGKSLCYQLPALLFQQHRPGSVVLVVSPLISLMEDQLRQLPPALQAGHLNSALSHEKRDQMVEEAREGKLAFLLISPEALVEQGRYATRNSLPPISFVCIDEVHCLADWSHHFRPSYLRVCSVLRSVFGVRCFLGLTATCTRRTMDRLAVNLGVGPEGRIRSPPLPPNLVMSASRDANKEEALVELLRTPRMRGARGVIVYCASRDLTERVASYVRTALRFEEDEEKSEEKKKKKKKKGPKWTAEAYHAGLTTSERSRLQKQFVRGSLRVLVATIAFGMGLDKSDVDVVIHFNVPKSFENYVQEVGRAGRDGSTAQCHVFLDGAQDALNDLKRHIYANSVDHVALKKLLRAVFVGCTCEQQAEECRGHLRAISIEEMTEAMNVREETVATILCYLVVFEDGALMKLERTVMRTCKLSCYKGGRALRKATHRSLALATALQLHGAFGGNEASLEVDLVALCERFGWSYATVRKELGCLEWCSEGGQAKKTGLKVEFGTKAWLVRARGALTEARFDQLMAYLQARLEQLENDAITNLSSLHRALTAVTFESVERCARAEEADLAARSAVLTAAVADFFDDRGQEAKEEASSYPTAFEAGVKAHVRSFLSIYRHDHKLNGRTIACILHGIGTPLFPAVVWGRVRRFWRSQLAVDWPTLRRWATEELVGN